MSKPDIIPQTTSAGIAVDPRTLERVVPESRRADGSVRKERKIRPGFTPQEDVSRFRGSRQAQMDRNALPKGHIIGWVPPSADSQPVKTGLSKSAKKNEKRKEKRKEAAQKKVAESWEDDDDDDMPTTKAGTTLSTNKDTKPSGERKESGDKDDEEALAETMGKLGV
ncbi:hypothetical protein PUNSTDRAFT_64750 [Punctularia strigosozonata HHB-11173 SS5]|uniref:uncharacterized protein n=1 Tax=Punctularia strigosozonata (strain HHB-11173) TaxID=741275 RepID=UPI0004417777|nr:uncharacterized protein PUNSTDRAFT_64750 [Punctularia strigosozonata HHB-11173 SS5]EIN10696.1 hypothetical protein PUNSTDRAFT_64750 [Punctularia strigosozonata HHB-11173 SS5]